MTKSEAGETNKAVEMLKELGVVRGILVRMARHGQLHEIRCEMPTCYCPKGREYFDVRSQPMKNWALNADHYPLLKMHGGKLIPSNVRLAHVLCNRKDYSWRVTILKMLEQGMSLQTIADELNDKGVGAPHGTGTWTAASVRKAYVS